MKTAFLFLLPLFFISQFAFAQGRTYGTEPKKGDNRYISPPAKLKRTSIGKRVTVALPLDFTPMPDEGIAVKYPAARKPIGVFTSPNGQIDFSVSEKPSTFINRDLNLVKDIYKASILRTFTEVRFIRQEIKQIDKKDMIVFEFVSTLTDENPNSKRPPVKKYTIIQYYLQGGKLMIFTFNVPYLLKDNWEEIANQVMNSIKVS